MKVTAFERITKMLEMTHTDEAVFSPTELYKEGWMLRIILSILSEGIECSPFTFQSGARWFSEAEIVGPFHPRKGHLKRDKKERIAEGPTHLDGVIGHFIIRPDTKVGFRLTDDSTQFLVIEAKMGSPLTSDVTYAEGYDQAARTVACMAWEISEANRSATDFSSLGFYVTAPHEQITKGMFSSEMEKSSIREKVKNRISRYANEKEYDGLQSWYNDCFLDTLDEIRIDCISWETLIHKIGGDDSIRDFYKRCLHFK